MILVVLMEHFSRAQQKSKALNDMCVRAFDAVMTWLQDLMEQLESPPEHNLEPRQIRQLLLQHYKEHGIDEKDYQGSFERMMKICCKGAARLPPSKKGKLQTGKLS